MTLPPVNCDLGEGECPDLTRRLLSLVDQVNIACGGHAGDDRTMADCLERARTEQVCAGAHPGIPDRVGFGRDPSVAVSPMELVELLEVQVGRFHSIARDLGVRVHHIKLHGALYHRVDQDPELGRVFLGHVARHWPDVSVVARAGGGLAMLGKSFPVTLWQEAFLDRAYHADGTLVPRNEPGAVLHEPDLVMGRIRDLLDRGGWRSFDDCWISLDPDTLCVHGDSPKAVAMLTQLRTVHPRRGFRGFTEMHR